MLINDEIQMQLLQLFAKSSNAPTVQAEQGSSSKLQLNPGQQVLAEIVANLPDHRYLARIAGELFNIKIPLNIAPGESLVMNFVSADPRYTFELIKPGASSAVSLSSLGKLLSSILSDAGERQAGLFPPSRMGVISDAPPEGTVLLAAKIKDTLTLNGLFYESHLAAWVAGDRLLGDIRREPQGKLKPLRLQDVADGSSIENDAVLAGDLIRNDSSSLTSPVVDPQAYTIIKEQLALLHSGKMEWQGEVWPDQPMELAIEEQKHDDDRCDRTWETNLVMNMKNLGGIRATLTITGTTVAVFIDTDGAQAAPLMNCRKDELRNSMESAGLKLKQLVVRDADQG